MFYSSQGQGSGSDAALDHLRDTKTIVLTTFKRHRVLQALLVPVAHRLMRYKTMHYELLLPTDGLPLGPERGAERTGPAARKT
jgi:hypothetical protein